MIGSGANSGLGMLAWEFYTNLQEYITKVLVIHNGSYQCFPERFNQWKYYTQGQLVPKVLEDFLDNIDILLAIETPYNWFAFTLAKYKKIKTVLIPMFECNDKVLEVYPSLIACPSMLEYESFKNEPSKLEIIPLPINRKRLLYKNRKKAMVFKHHVGHAGLAGRTGTNELLKAIPLVKNRNIKFIINSQVEIPRIQDERLIIKIGNIKNYWDLWNEGDIYIFPTNQEMISMPLNEALSVGMPVLTTEFDYFKSFLPQKWFIKPEEITKVKLHQRFMNFAVKLDIEKIAQKIDEFAEKDISEDSKIANRLAEEISWEKLRPKWVKLFESLLL